MSELNSGEELSSTSLTIMMVHANKHLVLYEKMCDAISICSRVDECKDIADRSVALAAYYKQIKDDRTVQKFNQVRLRAWRQVGKLFSAIDLSACETQSAKAKVIRASFDDGAMAQISDSRIYEILQLSAVGDEDFEDALTADDISGSIPNLIYHTAAWRDQIEQERQKRQQPPPPPTREQIARQRERLNRERLEEEHLNELARAGNVAMEEVGITLDRKDRLKMKQVVFLIKHEVYEVMRKASYDKKMTMQKILRSGLKMWLVAHDYEYPPE